MSELDWPALSRPLRGCGIGALVLLAFLAFWQLAVPAARQAPGGGVGIWFLIVPLSLVLPCGLALPVSAGRRLWRAGRRAAALGPVTFLLLGLFGLPVLVPGSWAFAALPLVLLASAALSAYLIVSTRLAPRPLTPSPGADASAADREINLDDPSGYARDVSVKRARR
jgi:hypothetical protein